MTARKLITTPQIDEQMNVSTPKRAVIVYCSLIEKADDDITGGLGRRFCSALKNKKTYTQKIYYWVHETQFPPFKMMMYITHCANVHF